MLPSVTFDSALEQARGPRASCVCGSVGTIPTHDWSDIVRIVGSYALDSRKIQGEPGRLHDGLMEMGTYRSRSRESCLGALVLHVINEKKI